MNRISSTGLRCFFVQLPSPKPLARIAASDNRAISSTARKPARTTSNHWPSAAPEHTRAAGSSRSARRLRSSKPHFTCSAPRGSARLSRDPVGTNSSEPITAPAAEWLVSGPSPSERRPRAVCLTPARGIPARPPHPAPDADPLAGRSACKTASVKESFDPVARRGIAENSASLQQLFKRSPLSRQGNIDTTAIPAALASDIGGLERATCNTLFRLLEVT